MSSPAVAYRAAQETALRASTALATAMNGTLRIYTVVPERAPLPYVLAGEDQLLVEVGGCAEEGEIFATVNWWTKPEPPQANQARNMGAAIVDALLDDLTLMGHVIDVVELQEESYATDPDGSTHGRAVFHYLTTQTV